MGFELNDKNGMITNATFAYIKLQEGAKKYQSEDKEYCLDIIVDKATAKAFKKAYPKNGYKEIDTGDFEGIFKFAAPYPDEDEQFVIKLKVGVSLSADIPSQGLSKGDPIPYDWSTRPKLFVPVEGGVKDVTMTTLAANGSKGDVAFNVRNTTYGNFPQLTGVLVKELIEYEAQGSGSVFGSVVGGFNQGDGNTMQKADAGEQKSQELEQTNSPAVEPPPFDSGFDGEPVF